MRTENCLGSAGGSSSLPSRSSSQAPPAASTSDSPTTAQRHASSWPTTLSRARAARPAGASYSNPPPEVSTAGVDPSDALRRGSSQRESAGISNTATSSEAPSDATTANAMPSIKRAASP